MAGAFPRRYFARASDRHEQATGHVTRTRRPPFTRCPAGTTLRRQHGRSCEGRKAIKSLEGSQVRLVVPLSVSRCFLVGDEAIALAKSTLIAHEPCLTAAVATRAGFFIKVVGIAFRRCFLGDYLRAFAEGTEFTRAAKAGTTGKLLFRNERVTFALQCGHSTLSMSSGS